MTARTRTILLIATLVLVAAGLAIAGTFVSFNGKFVITYPDTWQQMDYNSVDYFLYHGGQRKKEFEYEAAFAPKASSPWFADAYLVLTVDTLPGIAQKQIDSILQSLAASLGKPLQTRNRAELLNNLQQGQVVYDNTTQTAAVITEFASNVPGDKHSLLILRFFDRGIANFYCYAPDSSFQKHLPLFSDIVSSLSTENVEASVPRETLKVAEPVKTQSAPSEKPRLAFWIPTAGILIILIAVAVARRRRRRTETER